MCDHSTTFCADCLNALIASAPMKPDYSTNDPKGWGGDPKRGAAMGRGSYHAEDKSAPVKLYLRRVRLDGGGYDPNGTYFGTGAPLYWCSSADGSVDFMVRSTRHPWASDHRFAVREQVRALYPKARFYR